MVRLRQALFQDENGGRDVATKGSSTRSRRVKTALSSGVPAREPLQVLQGNSHAYVSAASA